MIAGITFGCVGVSAVVSVVWFLTGHGSGRFEPAVQTLCIVAGLTGVLAERRAVARERRDSALRSLADELRTCESILSDPRLAPSPASPSQPRVYPRLPVSAADAALASGALSGERDAELVGRLHAWRDEVAGLNRRLELTELRIFTAGHREEFAEFQRALLRPDGVMNDVRQRLWNLRRVVV